MPGKSRPKRQRSDEKAVLLLRVSTKKQLDTAIDIDPDGLSIATQRDHGNAKAAAMGVEVATEFVEPGYSAKTIDKRPVFRDLLRYLGDHPEVRYVIVYMRSRAFRNRFDAANGYIRDQQSKQLRPRTQEEKATFYKAAIASTVIATAKEAFAVAPAATQARVVVLRNDKRILRSAKLGAIYAATFERSAVMDRDWKSAEPGDLVYGAADVRIDDPGNGATLRTLSAKQHPDLGDIARQIGSALDESDAEQN